MTTVLKNAALDNPASLENDSIIAMQNADWDYFLRIIISAAPFHHPFESFFWANGCSLNLNHPLTKELIRCCAALRLHKLKKTQSKVIIGNVEDCLKAFVSQLSRNTYTLELHQTYDLDEIQSSLDALWSTLNKTSFYNVNAYLTPLKEEDFIKPHSTVYKKLAYIMETQHPEARQILNEIAEHYLRPFGSPLTDIKPEEIPEELIQKLTDLKISF